MSDGLSEVELWSIRKPRIEWLNRLSLLRTSPLLLEKRHERHRGRADARKCYGIELDSLYVDTIVRRWQKFTGLSAVRGISGRKFADLEEEVVNGQRQ